MNQSNQSVKQMYQWMNQLSTNEWMNQWMNQIINELIKSSTQINLTNQFKSISSTSLFEKKSLLHAVFSLGLI